jgi:chemotaxis protein histidine kinase CheA
MELNENIFYDEFLNKLTTLHSGLVELQNDYTNKEQVDDIFRSLHTIKSSADLLGMFDVVVITHKAEDLLEEIRKGNITANEKLVSFYFELEEFLNISVNNTVEGIYDDISAQDLAVYLTNELDKYLEQPELLNKKTILVVESSSLNRYMIKKIALDLGHIVYITDNGIDASKKIKEQEIDIIFADVTGHCNKCIEFVKEIKSDILYDHIPIVMLVDLMDMKMKKIGYEIKAKAWLVKPIKGEQVKVLLDKLVK